MGINRDNLCLPVIYLDFQNCIIQQRNLNERSLHKLWAEYKLQQSNKSSYNKTRIIRHQKEPGKFQMTQVVWQSVKNMNIISRPKSSK